MMSTLNKFDDKYILIVKGSFESIMSNSTKVFLNGKTKNITKKLREE